MKTISPRLRDLIVAILTALITYLCSACSSVWIKGSDNNPVIEHTPHVSADSTTFVKFRFGNAKNV